MAAALPTPDSEDPRREWEDLTHFCLLNVLSRLSLEDRWKGASLVCKPWLLASKDPSLFTKTSLPAGATIAAAGAAAMAAYSKLARGANPLLYAVPSFLAWRQLGFRSICSGRLGFMSASASLESDLPPAPPTKVLECFSEDFEIGSRLAKFETGKLARFANGAVVMGIGETKVLSTVTSARGDGVRDFLPLSVRRCLRVSI